MNSIRLPDSISRGAHASPSDGMCVMETVAYIAGEPHSDHPECACPVITAFAQHVNDYLPSDGDRMRLLAPLVWKIVGTSGSVALMQRRAFRCADWAWREIAPLGTEVVLLNPPILVFDSAAAAVHAGRIAYIVAHAHPGHAAEIWESAAALLAELCEMQDAEVSR